MATISILIFSRSLFFILSNLENLTNHLSFNKEQKKSNNSAEVPKMAEIRPNIRVNKEIRFGRSRIPNSIIRLRLSRSRKSMSKFGFGFLSFKPSFLCSLPERDQSGARYNRGCCALPHRLCWACPNHHIVVHFVWRSAMRPYGFLL